MERELENETGKLKALLNEVKGIKHCLLAGWYEKAYEQAQNAEDAITRMMIITYENEKASLLPPQSNEANP